MLELAAIVVGVSALSMTGPGDALAQGAVDTAPVVACEVMGHDLILYNRGAEPIPAGSVVHWSVRLGRKEGDHILEADLQPFVGLSLSGALGASYLWDRPCEAAVVAQPNGGP